MQTLSSGGRRASKAALEARALGFEKDRVVTRKELTQIIRDAQKALQLRPSVRLVLQVLASCWGEQMLEGRLLVWPSNDYIAEKTGLSERAIRYAFRSLIADQLVLPKDSANGKRFAIKNRAGDVIDAFGFDLRPLYARAHEFAEIVDAIDLEREARKRAHDDLTIMRRATQATLEALLEASPAPRTDDLIKAFDELVGRTPRRSSSEPVDQLLEQWSALKELAEKRLLETGSGGKTCRLIETNNEAFHHCNKAFETGEAREAAPESLSLRLVVEATPCLVEYGVALGNWQDAYAAARQFRPLLGAHHSAWEEAVDKLGLELATATVLYVTQLLDDDAASGAGRIRNPGGYFRALVRLMIDGRFNLSAELARLKRRRE